MIQKFDNFISESLSSIFNKEYTYKDKVASSLVNILMDVNGISEKSFSQVDNLIANVKDVLSNNQKAIEIILAYESDDKRPDFCAEMIYDMLLRKK